MVHAEWMSCMTLGAPLYSLHRILFNRLAVFVQWENEKDLEKFLQEHPTGKLLNKGWHTKLELVRQWGNLSSFDFPTEKKQYDFSNSTVVAVTLAKMKLWEVPRFIQWGRPVEKLVRDHPGKKLALASIRFPNTVSTFTIWHNQKEMTDMVFGHSNIPEPKRHIDAMNEREKKDFHFEFTTLRFKSISEFGSWNDQQNITTD